MARVSVRNGLRLGVLLAFGLAWAVSTAEATPRPRARRVLNLFSGFLSRQNVNRFDCGLNAVGEVCVDPGGSSTVGGGFWPKGTPDQYVFNSGLQLAGIVNPNLILRIDTIAVGPPLVTDTTLYPWAGDTIGAFFFDPKGTTVHGDRLSLVWNSLDVSDNANWPRDAYVPNDTSLYNPVLIGLKAASQQDTWARYWDGNPNNNAGRKHPLGVLVNQRGMGWNFPSGNEDIIYFLYTFTNITARDGAVYAGQVDADSLTSYGTQFQTLNEAAFGVEIPDTGYTITEMYAAFAMDADVSDAARENYSTAFLPFSMGTAFKRNWYAPSMRFTPASAFSAPFVPAPGIVGVKYLKSPVVAGLEVGLTMFSNTINQGAFDDAQNTVQLWRYLSAKLDPSAGDAPCNSGGVPAVTKVCFVAQSSDDVRFFQSSGPMDLKPGESKTIVVAYINAAPVGTPAIAARGQALDLKPGFPAQPAGMATGNPADSLRSVDRVFGAISVVGDTNGNGKIDQFEVRTVPRSLLNKGLVAQAVFDARFLLPFPPAAPEFFLVPGDNQVTVVWKQSATETDTIGDPYFAVSSDSSSVLFDPNYRQRDVEGYRIYRGRTTGDLELIAQFDYAGTLMVDWTAAFDYGNCAPELANSGKALSACPQPVDTATNRFTAGEPHELSGEIVQIPPGGRTLTFPDTNVLVLQSDTALTGGGAEGSCRPGVCPPVSNTGVPFAFTDHGVKNSFTYYYAVTAFDVNSVQSVGVGSTSLESPRTAKSIVPRKPSGQQTAGLLSDPEILGSNGQPIPAVPPPTLDANTGIWSGPQQPTDGLELGLAAFVPEVLNSGALTLKIDSITPGYGDPEGFANAAPVIYHVTVQGSGAPSSYNVPVELDCCDIPHTGNVNFSATPITGSKSTRFGGDSTFALYGSAEFTTAPPWFSTGPGRGDANNDPPSSAFNGPRWWAGAPNENTPNPNGANCSPSVGACVPGNMTGKITAGAIPGVDVLWNIQSYNTVRSLPARDLEALTGGVSRAADFSVYWGAGGVVDSVIDDVHKIPVPQKAGINASWGILDTSSFAGVTSSADGNNAQITWSDIMCVDPAPTYTQNCGNGATPRATLHGTAKLSPVSAISAAYGTAVATTGNGFIFYLNGKFFLMQMAALPATGTVWHARFYTGNITGSASGGNFAHQAAPRTPAAPGLRMQVAFQGSTFDATTTTAAQLAAVHTVPDPYYVTNALEQSPNSKKLRFVNLPSQSIVRIYSLSGVLVQVLTLNDATGGGEVEWNLRNRNNQFVASGVYFYHVEAPDGKTKVGRFTVVNFAQ
jgi:hypothetical protein